MNISIYSNGYNMTDKLWICKDCGQKVLAREKPSLPMWSDFHVCSFEEVR